MPLKAPAPPPPPVYNWTGFYVGAHLGAGWARKAWADVDQECFGEETFVCRPQYLGEHNAKGVLGGFQVGYNYQVNSWFLIGIEGQFSFADLKGDHQDTFSAASGFTTFICVHDTCGIPIASAFQQLNEQDRFFTKVRDIATIAGRIGWVGGPSGQTMWYVKGGGAWARDNFAVRSTGSFLQCETLLIFSACNDANFDATLAGSQSRWGWMVGTGLEFALFGNWSAKVEYNYLDLGKKNVRLAGTGCVTSIGGGFTECDGVFRDVRIDQTLHIVKFGINYHFWNPAVAARY
jgi:outer membrane immunogenic protein